MRPLLLFFIAMPILEMYVLIQVGGQIGAIPTIALVVLTATLGIWLLRLEGMATLKSVQEKLSRGEIPGQELLEGIMLLVGGALLLTPGFLTDAIGFSCLLPFLRKPIAQWLIHKGVIANLKFGQASFNQGHSQQEPFAQPGSRHHTIDGEFEDRSRQSKPTLDNFNKDKD